MIAILLGSGVGGLLGGAYLLAATAAPAATRVIAAAASLRPRMTLASENAAKAPPAGTAVAPAALPSTSIPVLAAERPSDLQCLTEAVYFEARGEPRRGQQAVAQVVMNRVRHPGFPKTVCAVVHQRTEAGCQFSFACDARQGRRDPSAWRTAQAVAHGALRGAVVGEVRDATHFESVSAVAFTGLAKVARIGEHVFYRFLAPGEAHAATLRAASAAAPAPKAIMASLAVAAPALASITPPALSSAPPKAVAETATAARAVSAETAATSKAPVALVPASAATVATHPVAATPTAPAMTQS